MSKPRWYVNVVLRWGSFWVGCHFSRRHKSVCVALFPCVVIRIARTPYTPEPGALVWFQRDDDGKAEIVL